MRTALAAALLLTLSDLAPAAPAPLPRRAGGDAASELALFQKELSRVQGELNNQGAHLLAVRRGEAPRTWVVTYLPAGIQTWSVDSQAFELLIEAATPEQFANTLRRAFSGFGREMLMKSLLRQ